MAPEISIDVDRTGAASVYVYGIRCRAVKAVVAYPGADVMLVLDRHSVWVTAELAGAVDQDLAPRPLATDGQA